MEGKLEGTCPACHRGDLITIAMNVSGNDLAFTTCHLCEAKWWYRDGESVPAALDHRERPAASHLRQHPFVTDAVAVSPPRNLDRIFKAYDVRGVVPDELDEGSASAIGAAFADWSGVPTVSRGTRLPSVVAVARGRDPRGHRVAGDRRRRPRPRVDRPAVLRVGLARRRGGHAHREPQPAGVQRDEVLPAGGPSGGRGHGTPRDPRARRAHRGDDRGRSRPHPRRSGSSTPTRTTCSRSSTPARCVRSRSSPTPRTAWAAWSCRSCSNACR